MQCADLRKRSLEPELWSCPAKRACLEPPVAECPMETNLTNSVTNQQPAQQVRPQLCPRCLAGEPGHINHILRL